MVESKTPQPSGELVSAAWPDLFANLQAAYAKVIDAQFEMERRAAELEDSRDLLRQVIASMSEALFLLDRTGRVMQVNPAALSLIGRSEADCLGQLFRKICPDPNAPISAWKILNRSSKGSLTGLETELRGGDGQTRPVNLSASVVRNRNGRIEGVLIIAQNRASLAQSPTIQTQNQQQMVTVQLAGRLAETLATPAAALRGYSHHLRQISQMGETIDEQWLTDLERMAEAADEITQLVKHLHAIGRPALGVFKPVDVNQLVEAALLLTAVASDQEPIPIQRELAASLPPVQGDWHELAFALADSMQQMVTVSGQRLTAVTVVTKMENNLVFVELIGQLIGELTQEPSIVPASVHDVVARHNGEIKVKVREEEMVVIVALPGLGNEQ